jgi:hypothetical protein
MAVVTFTGVVEPLAGTPETELDHTLWLTQYGATPAVPKTTETSTPSPKVSVLGVASNQPYLRVIEQVAVVPEIVACTYPSAEKLTSGGAVYSFVSALAEQ